MNRFRIMNRFRFISGVAVVVVGLSGALLGLGAGVVPAAVAATMVAVGGGPHGRPGLASARQFLGQSVAVSGNTVVAGAPSTGAAYVFTRSGSTWSQQAKLTGAVGSFGSSVALSITPASGTTAVVGSSVENSFTGAAVVFVRSGTTWSRQATLTAAHGTANDGFGSSVALCGLTVVVGAPGAAAAYVFTRSGTIWSQHAKLTAAAAQFGDSVALYGSAVVVGAPGKNAHTGAAYVFQKA